MTVASKWAFCFTVAYCVDPVSYEFEPSLWHQNADIENSRSETCARNWPDVTENQEKLAAETRHHLANWRECRTNVCEPDMPYRDGAGWLGRQDSNLGIAESKSTPFCSNIKAHSEFLA